MSPALRFVAVGSRFAGEPVDVTHLPALGALLRGRLATPPFVLTSDTDGQPTVEAVSDHLRASLPPDGASGGAVLLYWVGHGFPRTGTVTLAVADSDLSEPPDFTFDRLVQRAMVTGATEILVLVDACYAGDEVLHALGTGVRATDQDRFESLPYLGLMSSAGRHQPATDGEFGQRLLRVLRDGPSDPGDRLVWNPHARCVTLSALARAINRGPSVEPKPYYVSQGDARLDVVPNPLYVEGAPPLSVEELWRSPPGAPPPSTDDDFSGRKQVLDEMAEATAGEEPGLLVLMGPPGIGKTAIASRFLSTEADRWAGTVTVPLGGLTAADVTASIHRNLVEDGILPATSVDPGTVGLLEAELRATDRTALVLLDGLDQAGAAGPAIVREVVGPLSTVAQVVLTTRGGADLRSLLPGHASIIDLTFDRYREDEDRSLRGYLRRRVEWAEPKQIDGLLEALREAAGHEGRFAAAEALTAAIRADPEALLRPGLVETAIGAALEKDIDALEAASGAAWDLLTALAFAHPTGMTLRCWDLAVRALGGESTFGRERTLATDLLPRIGRWVVEDGIDGTVAYRISHPLLAERLQRRAPESFALRLARLFLDEVAASILRARTTDGDPPLEQHLDPYLLRYAASHVADGGPDLVSALRILVSWAPTAGIMVANALVQIASRLDDHSALVVLLSERIGALMAADAPPLLVLRAAAERAVATGQAGHPADARGELSTVVDRMVGLAGPTDPDVLSARLALAFWTGEAGDPTEALTLSRALLPDQVATLGPEHRSVLVNRNNLLGFARRAGEPADVAGMEALVEDCARLIGAADPSAIHIRLNLADLRFETGDTQRALADEEELIIELKGLDIEPRLALLARRQHADHLIAAGQAQEGDEALLAILNDQRDRLGPHPDTFSTAAHVAWRSIERGEVQEGLIAFQSLVEEQEHHLAPLHPTALQSRRLLALAHERNGNLDEALDLLRALRMDQREGRSAAGRSVTAPTMDDITRVERQRYHRDGHVAPGRD